MHNLCLLADFDADFSILGLNRCSDKLSEGAVTCCMTSAPSKAVILAVSLRI